MTKPQPDRHARRLEDDRRVPWVVLSVLVVSTALIGVHPVFVVVLPACGYLLGRLRTPGWWLTVVLVLAVALSPALLDAAWWDVRVWTGAATAAVLLGFLPWLVGRHVRDRVDLERAEAELVRNLEQRQWELTARARLRERARIAQEMHDTLGHQLSLIALRAGALEVGIGSGSAAESQAAEELRAATTRAAEQLGDIVGLLADASEPTPRQPHPDRLEALVRHAADAGMTVEVAGPQPDLDGLPVVVARAALRVVQEGLTNAAKHAPGAAATVRIERREHEVIVRVIDNGATSHEVHAVSGGHGLVGLADRVEYLGGHLHAEPSGQGFELTAHLPTSGSESPTETDEAAWQQAELSAGRRRTQRSLAWIAVAPLGLLLLIAVCFTSYFVYVTIASVLTPQEFARIEVGDTREEAETILPPVEMLEPPTDRLPRPEDPAATCTYYEGKVSFFERQEVYRVCFSDGAVTDTDIVAPETP